MNVAAVESWLQSFAGLDAATLGTGVVARAVRERIKENQYGSAEEYLARLAISDEERHALIDRVVVPETWFFRDRPAFDALAKHVVGPWSRAHSGATFRLLSIPCSTGEEAYSMAMALALAGWPMKSLQIDAVDISRQNLTRARRGIYGKNSFRGDDLAFRGVFFEAAGRDLWRVSDRMREPVRFDCGNVLADEFPLGRLGYDAIFCRNLLIYFDRPTQLRTIRALDRLLVSDGWFAVGPAEPVLLLDQGYEALKVPAGFVLRRATAARGSAPAWSSKIGPAPLLSRTPIVPPYPVPAVAKGVASEPVLDPLRQLEQMVEAGRLRQAATLGETLLVQRGPSAGLLFQLALIAEMLGDVAYAEALFRKTLYLDPQRADALAHLALLAEKNGDARGARAYRERAQRVLLKEAK